MGFFLTLPRRTRTPSRILFFDTFKNLRKLLAQARVILDYGDRFLHQRIWYSRVSGIDETEEDTGIGGVNGDPDLIRITGIRNDRPICAQPGANEIGLRLEPPTDVIRRQPRWSLPPLIAKLNEAAWWTLRAKR